MDYEVAVIGAGVVGLACAAELAGRGRRVVIIERHPSIGTETSSRNSEVIHAGIYYPVGSLKATLCLEGNRRLYELCRQHGIAYQNCGKLIVATTDDEIPILEGIAAKAAANGVTLTWLTGVQSAALEPNVTATAALWSPTTGIVDSHSLMRFFRQRAEAHRADMALCCMLHDVEPLNGGYRLHVRDADGQAMTIDVELVINAAGLDADIVAAMAGIDIDACGYRLHYCRGAYFRLKPKFRHWVTRLVYPVPTPQTVGLGVHVTLDLAGYLRLGPDVEYLPERRQDYRVDTGRRGAFFEAVSRYLVGIDHDDLIPDQAGIRPKLQGPGDAPKDFVIAHEAEHGLPGWINLIGIESPGLTCAPVIAERVATLLA